MVASCPPLDASVTVSRSGHRVALTRLRRSLRSESAVLTLKGWISDRVSSVSTSGITSVIAVSLWRKRKGPRIGRGIFPEARPAWYWALGHPLVAKNRACDYYWAQARHATIAWTSSERFQGPANSALALFCVRSRGSAFGGRPSWGF